MLVKGHATSILGVETHRLGATALELQGVRETPLLAKHKDRGHSRDLNVPPVSFSF